jgi:hypothetical protein
VDCPHPYLPRTVRPESRTVRKRHQNLQRRTANNGPFAGSTRTVRQAPADRPLSTRGPSKTSPNQNLKTPQIENELSKNTKNTRRIGTTQTVREARTEQKTARPRRSTPPIHHRISQKVEAVETRVWDMKSVNQGCYTPKTSHPNFLNHQELRIL